LLQASPLRTATVATIDDCWLATLSYEAYNEHVRHLKVKKIESTIKWLRSTAFFGKWTNSMLTKLFSTMKEIKV
jgi:hypothetical protein